MNAATDGPGRIPLEFRRLPPREMLERACSWRLELARRRSVRDFSAEPLPEGLLDECIAAAASAPSGAHRQPWTFVVVRDPQLKREIRIAAEAEEHKFYSERISPQWRAALHPLGTDEHKPFLETAPVLIAVFRHAYGLEDGHRHANYYTQESVGIAVGFLLAALHHAGLATLTHTPNPMGFLQRVLRRPDNEKPFVLIPVGYPAESCQVPALTRKPLDEVRVVL